jgi:hypothetical protein
VNREEQRTYREAKARLASLEKLNCRAMGYLRSHDYIYKFVGQFAFWVHIRVDQAVSTLVADVRVKSLELDDIYWSAFELPECRDQPKSFHVWGAFTSPFYLYEEGLSVAIVDGMDRALEQLLTRADEAIERFTDTFPTLADFQTLLRQDKHQTLNYVLSEIYLGHFQSALSLTETQIAGGRHGGFASGGKDIYEYIRNYCIVRC